MAAQREERIFWEILTDCRPGGEEHQSWELHFSDSGDFSFPIESLYNPKISVVVQEQEGSRAMKTRSVEIRETAENVTLNKVVQFHPREGILFNCTGGNGISYVVFARDVYAKRRADKEFKQSLEDHRHFVSKMAVLLDSDKADSEFYGLDTDDDDGGTKPKLATDAVLTSLAQEHPGATPNAIQQRLKIVTACVSSSEELKQFLKYIKQDPSSAFPISDCQYRSVYSYGDNTEVEFDITLTGIASTPSKQGLHVLAKVDKVNLNEIDRSFEEQQDGGSDEEEEEEEEDEGESSSSSSVAGSSSKKRKANANDEDSNKKKKKKKKINNPDIQQQLETKFLGKTIVIPLQAVHGSVYKTDGTSLVAINDYLQCWLPYADLTNPRNPYLHRRLPKLF